jgi:hypothetical protein
MAQGWGDGGREVVGHGDGYSAGVGDLTAPCQYLSPLPNAFGLWNMLYVWSRPHHHLPIGLHGALLPVILVSIGAFSAVCGGFLAIGAHGVTWFQAISVPYMFVGLWFIGAMVLYYLLWKYVVGFLNQVLGIA